MFTREHNIVEWNIYGWKGKSVFLSGERKTTRERKQQKTIMTLLLRAFGVICCAIQQVWGKNESEIKKTHLNVSQK